MHKLFVSCWHRYYTEKTGQVYIYDGQQMKHLKLLIKKIETKIRERGMEPNEENMTASFNGFLSMIKDKWILEHLDIAIINSKFNQLYVAAVRENPFTAHQRLERLISEQDSQRAGRN